MSYDVIIVGAGPGGGAAAHTLVGKGCRVLVLEKARLPRYKTCGGAVPRAALGRFPFSFDSVIQAEVARVCYSLRGQEEVIFPLPGRAIAMVMRDRFDSFLIEQAGCEVRDGATVVAVEETSPGVKVKTASGETLRSSYLIGADGAASTVALRLGLRQGRVLCPALEVEAQAPFALLDRYAETALFMFGVVPRGYLWFFPKGDHLSVGISTSLRGRVNLRDILAREMAWVGLTMEGATLHGHSIPFYAGREVLNTARCLLVGDAAGLVDPLTGEGIRYALWSGHLAAQAILAGKVEAYSDEVHRQIGYSLHWARRGARVFYGLPDFAFRFGARNPRATRAFAAMLSGQMDYRTLVFHILGCVAESLWRRPAELLLRNPSL
jgi:geranylgeranyl reductase family protein